MKKHFLYIIFLVWLSPIIALGQDCNFSISGKVMDKEEQEPLIGVNIVISGTTTGVASDLDGNFKLDNLCEGIYELEFSYIGKKTISHLIDL
ncbi:MAG: carboxypeptidase-like regulatory domain-containing protein, partial [Saprospiraceae bacterium]